MFGFISTISVLGTLFSLFFVMFPKKTWPAYSSRRRALGMLLVFLIGLPVLAGLSGLANSPSQPASSPTTTASLPSADIKHDALERAPHAAEAGTQPEKPAEASHWTYHESTDEMRGITTRFASTESEEEFKNMLGLGGEKTTLTVQKRPKGYDIELNNSSLQFTCNNFSNTHMSLKFDDGPVTSYSCSDAVGDKFGVAFVSPGSRIVEKLRHARKLTVEAEVFQRGATQMSFRVDGLQI